MGLTRNSGSQVKDTPGAGNYRTSVSFGKDAKNNIVPTFTNVQATSVKTSVTTFRQAFNDPSFKTKVRAGIAPSFCEQHYSKRGTLPWKGTKLSWTSTGAIGDVGTRLDRVVGSFDPPSPPTGYYGYEGSEANLTAAMKAATDSRATTNVLNKIKDQKVNIGQVIAERGQTARLIGDSAITIAKTLMAVKRGNLVDAAHALGVGVPKRAAARAAREVASQKGSSASQISRRWLELKYGWQPLLSDVYGLMEHLALRESKPRYFSVTASASSNTSFDQCLKFGTIENWKATGTMKYKVRYTIRYVQSNGNLRELSQTGITNPALLAWELLPWSFVIDWFVPIGNYISSLDATAGTTFVDGCKSIVADFQSHNLQIVQGPNGSGTTFDSKLESFCFRKTIDRTVLTSFPTPVVPFPKSPASLVHLANALSLLQLQRK